MTLTGIVILLVVGALAGWVAGYLVHREKNLSLFDVVVGIIGSFVGGWIAYALGLGVSGPFWTILLAIIGAVVVVLVVDLLRRG